MKSLSSILTLVCVCSVIYYLFSGNLSQHEVDRWNKQIESRNRWITQSNVFQDTMATKISGLVIVHSEVAQSMEKLAKEGGKVNVKKFAPELEPHHIEALENHLAGANLKSEALGLVRSNIANTKDTIDRVTAMGIPDEPLMHDNKKIFLGFMVWESTELAAYYRELINIASDPDVPIENRIKTVEERANRIGAQKDKWSQRMQQSYDAVMERYDAK